MSESKKTKSEMPWPYLAEIALKEAVAKAIADHARTGDPIVVWRDGRVVLEYVTPAGVAEAEGQYGPGNPDKKRGN